jgi:hypothetical protein
MMTNPEFKGKRMNPGHGVGFRGAAFAVVAYYSMALNVSWAASAAETPTQGKESVHSSPMAVVELENLDKRKPVPLSPMMANHQKQNMREHLEAVQAIVSGLSRNDFSAVEKAAKSMGYSEEMKQMCTHMGAGAPGFTELAIQFHKNADLIADAARFKDSAATLKALNTTLQNCTSCHAQFRQQIVDKAQMKMHSK